MDRDAGPALSSLGKVKVACSLVSSKVTVAAWPLAVTDWILSSSALSVMVFERVVIRAGVGREALGEGSGSERRCGQGERQGAERREGHRVLGPMLREFRWHGLGFRRVSWECGGGLKTNTEILDFVQNDDGRGVKDDDWWLRLAVGCPISKRWSRFEMGHPGLAEARYA